MKPSVFLIYSSSLYRLMVVVRASFRLENEGVIRKGKRSERGLALKILPKTHTLLNGGACISFNYYNTRLNQNKNYTLVTRHRSLLLPTSQFARIKKSYSDPQENPWSRTTKKSRKITDLATGVKITIEKCKP